MIKITRKDIVAELKKEDKNDICPVCLEKLPEDAHHVRKYHEDCAEIIKKIVARKYMQQKTPEQKLKSVLKSRIKHQMKSPSCMYQQTSRCVKRYIEIEGIQIAVDGKMCPFRKNRGKCPDFKPLHPEIYDKFCKSKKKK